MNSKKDSGQAGMTELGYFIAGLINFLEEDMHGKRSGRYSNSRSGNNQGEVG
jgi:hypothetical protein